MESIIKKFNAVFKTDLRKKSRGANAYARHIYMKHCHDNLGMRWGEAAQSIGFDYQAAKYSKKAYSDMILAGNTDFMDMILLFEKKIRKKTFEPN